MVKIILEKKKENKCGIGVKRAARQKLHIQEL